MFSPDKSTLANRPSSTLHPQTPAQKPIVGRALKLQGQPQSQLQPTKCMPLRYHVGVFLAALAMGLELRGASGEVNRRDRLPRPRSETYRRPAMVAGGVPARTWTLR